MGNVIGGAHRFKSISWEDYDEPEVVTLSPAEFDNLMTAAASWESLMKEHSEEEQT
jgi:hypothetical protein